MSVGAFVIQIVKKDLPRITQIISISDACKKHIQKEHG